MAIGIHYTVAMPRPHTHLLPVEVHIEGWLAEQVDLVMPSWTPGSYLIRDYARHVQEFVAEDAAGRPLRFWKVEKNRWRVETGGADAITVRYKVYAFDLSVRTNYLDGERALLNGAATFMYPDGWQNRPVRLTVRPAPGWAVVTSLKQAGEGVYEAENFDGLVDSPVLCGSVTQSSFTAVGVPHTVAIDGAGNYDMETVCTDLRRIVETAAAIFGGLPYDRYVFLVLLTERRGGGLEHLFSNTCILPRLTFRPRQSYERFLSTEAHEHFHTWLVKRIRPQALLPLDYTREQYTRLLWVMEGMTEYYTDQVLLRSGLISSECYLERLADDIKELQATPGRLVQSLEEASFDAWIKFYRPDENTMNSSISYYLKGSLVSALLDLTIRGETNGAKSLDDVMRALWADPLIRAHGIAEDGFQGIAEAAAGVRLEEVFAKYVRGVDEIAWDRYLEDAGLKLEVAHDDEKDKARAYLGVRLRQEGEAAIVESVPSDTPAYDAGVYVGDEIIALDSFRVTRTGLEERLASYAPGDTVRLNVLRQGALREIPVTLAARPPGRYQVRPLDNPSAAQVAVRRAWLCEQE